MNIVSDYGIYLLKEKDAAKHEYTAQRMPVTYRELENGLIGVTEYAQNIQDELFILVNETHTFIIKAVIYHDNHLHYIDSAEGQDVSYLFAGE